MEQVKKSKTVGQVAVVGAKLLLICALVAGIISFVYTLTDEQYEKNITETKNQALGEIFGLSSMPTSKTISDVVSEETVYEVYDGETFIGYCVEVKQPGFGGDVELMVGYDPTLSICGVSVVAHAETPGFGAKAAEAAYLEQYADKRGELTLGEDIDAISGATISSRAVNDAVNFATETLQGILAEREGAQ